jgi:hypothetical protein
VSVRDFKSCGSCFAGPVGSIPTHFRHRRDTGNSRGERRLATKPRKPKPFRATKEVKRRARLAVGAPPAVQRHETRQRKPPKHKKRLLEQEGEG